MWRSLRESLNAGSLDSWIFGCWLAWPARMRRWRRKRGQSGLEATRRAKERNSREHINKLDFTRFSSHPAGIWRAPQKLSPVTLVSWLRTSMHTQNVLSHALPTSSLLSPPSCIVSLTNASFLMIHLSAVIIAELFCHMVLPSQC